MLPLDIKQTILKRNISLVYVIIFSVMTILSIYPDQVLAVGAPDYKPDGVHPRIWLTPDVISLLKAKKAANDPDWQGILLTLDTSPDAFVPTYKKFPLANVSFYGLYTWPAGNGYVGSGFGDSITLLGLAYNTLKTTSYDSGCFTMDQITTWTKGSNIVTGTGLTGPTTSSLIAGPDGTTYSISSINGTTITLSGNYTGPTSSWSAKYFNGGTDDKKAFGYAQIAFGLMRTLMFKYSAGEEQDGIEFIRMSDNGAIAVSLNVDEAAATHPNGIAYLSGGTQYFKSGYATRNLTTALPLFYDWFYNDYMMTSALKTVLYSSMYRGIDWYNGTRSKYNNGIKIGSTYYHEDNFGQGFDSNWTWSSSLPGACTGNNNCNIYPHYAATPQNMYGYSNYKGMQPDGATHNGIVGTNFYDGYVGWALLCTVAAYGDPPTADGDHYLNYGKSLYNYFQENLTNPTKNGGGDSLEGMGYFGAWDFFIQGVLGYNTATGFNTWGTKANGGLANWPLEMVDSTIHNWNSTMTNQVMRGQVYVSPTLKPTESVLNPFFGTLKTGYPASRQLGNLQYFLSNADLLPFNFTMTQHYWSKFLFRDSNTTPTVAPLSLLSSMPLSHVATGTGLVETRSSWNPTATDTVLGQVTLGQLYQVDHQASDQGNFNIVRGSDRLLSHHTAGSYGDMKSQGQNAVVFCDGCSTGNGLVTDQNLYRNWYMNPSAEIFTTPAIDKKEEGGSYFYVSGDLTKAFTSGTNGRGLANYNRRTILHLRPNFFVVYDVTESNPSAAVIAPTNAKAWYMQFEAVPTIDTANNLVSITKGNSKLFTKTLYPTGGTYTDTDLSSTENTAFSTVFHRVKYVPATPQRYDQFLTVLEATALTATQTSMEKILSTEGKMIGTYIKDATNPSVVMFSTDKNGLDATGNVTYTLSAIAGKSPWHTIVHLPANTDYNVIRTKDVSGAETFQLIPTPGAVYKTSSQGVLRLAPDITIQTPATGDSIAGKKKISLVIPDNFVVTGMEILVDGTKVTPTPPFTVPNIVELNTLPLTTAAHTVAVVATDAAGATSQSNTITVTVARDTTAPTVAITDPLAGALVFLNKTVKMDVIDNYDVAAINLYVDSALKGTIIGPAPYSITWNTTTYPDGNHILSADATDSSGNTGTSASVTVLVSNDAILPVVTAFTMPATATSLAVAVSSFTATDNSGVVTGYLLTETNTKPAPTVTGWSATAPSTYTFSASGSKTLYAWAKDAMGNVSDSSALTVAPVAIETVPPVISSFTIQTPVNTLTVPVITLTATDNIAVSGYLITTSATAPLSSDSGWNATKPSNYTFAAGTPDGSKTLYAWAKDAAGNVSTGSSALVAVDLNPPVVSTFTVPSTSTNLTVASITLIATDTIGVTGYLITESSTAPATSASGWTTTAPTSYTFAAGTSDGSKTLYAWAKDNAGNVSASKSAPVSIDLNPPLVATFSVPTTSTNLTVSVITLTASDTIGVTGYLINESIAAPLASDTAWTAITPTSYTFPVGTADGSKTLYARAKDAAGNISAAKSSPVTIDLNPPYISTFTVPASSTSLTVAGITLTATDTVGVSGYLITESATAPATSAGGWTSTIPTSYTFAAGTTDGSKTLYAWAKDAIGFVSVSKSAPVTIDLNPPLVATFTVPASSTSLTVSGIALTATDTVGVSGYQITENASAPLASGSGWSAAAPTSYTFAAGTADGAKTLYAWAKDAVGFVSAAKNASVTIDLTPPAVATFTAPTSSTTLTVVGITLTANDTVGVSGYQITESATAPLPSGSGWSATAPTSYTFAAGTTDGAKTLYAWAKDAAGFVSTAKSAPVTIDLTPPTVDTFTIPASTTSLTVSGITLSATDTVGVNGYLITASATASASGWSATAPTNYTFAPGTPDGKINLYAWAKDAVGLVSVAKSAPITIDLNPPVVTSFTAPATSGTLVVAGISLIATDTVGVSGYLITESATAPAASLSSWSSTPQTSYTFAAGTADGAKTLYAWAKDAIGFISAGKSTTVTIDKTAPAISITTVASPTNQTGQTLGGSVSDANGVASVTVQVGSEPAAPATISGTNWSLLITGLISGSNTVTVTARDLVGNSAITTTTIIVDQSLPTVSLTSVKSPTNLTSQLLSGTVNSTQAVASVTVQIGSATAAAATISGNSWSYQLSALAIGPNAVTITARNVAGNVASITSTINVDQTPPTVSITPVSSPTKLSSQTVSGSVTDNIGITAVTVQLGSGIPAAATVTPGNPATWSFALSGLSAGSNSITVSALDASGNSSSSATTIILDQTAPTVSIAPVSSPTRLSSQTVSGSVTDNIGVATVTVQLGSGVPTAATLTPGNPATWSFALSGLIPGSNSITVTALDTAANSSSTGTTIIVDQTPPVVTLAAVVSPTNQTGQTVSGTVSDANGVASVTVQVGSGPLVNATISGNSWSFPITGLAIGSNALTVTALDTLGNSATTTATIIVDQSSPTVTLTSVSTQTNLTSQLLSGTVSSTQAVASVTVQVGSATAGSATITGNTWSYQLSALPTGSNAITIVARNVIGTTASITSTISVDKTAPTVSIAPVSSPTKLSSQTVSGSVTDNVGVKSVTVQIGSGIPTAATLTPGNPASWSLALSGLMAGSNAITVTALDTSGNSGSTASTIIVDQTPPAISFTTVASPTNQTGQTVSGTISDATGVASVTVQVGSGAAANATVSGSSWSYPVSGLASGSNSITVTALDTLGNSTTATATIIVDLSVPTVTLTSVSSPTSLTSQLLSGTVSSTQAVSSVTVQVGSASAAAATISGNSWSYQLSALSVGSNAITIVVRNALGNTASITSTIIVDKTAPTVSIVPVSSPTRLSSQTVSGSVTDNVGVKSVTVQIGSGVPAAATLTPGNPSSWSYALSGLNVGSNAITVTALDTSGNSGSTVSTIVVDQTAPTISLTTVASPTNQTAQTLSGTVSDSIGVASVTVQVGSGPAANATVSGSSWSFPVSGLAVGSNTITITALDSVGNSATASTTIIVDQSLPTVTLTSVSSPTNLTSQLVSGTVNSTQAVTSVTVQVGSGAAAAATISGNSWSYQLSALPAGSNAITIVVRNVVGTTASITSTIIVDQAPPVITLAAVTSPTSQTSQRVSGTVSDTTGVASVTVKVGSGPAANATVSGSSWSYSVSGLVSGSNTITVTALDSVGNSATATGTIIVDQSVPIVTLASVSSPTNLTSQLLSGTVSSTQAVASVTVQVGSAAAAAATISGNSWSYQLSALPAGSNIITIVVRNVVGTTASVTSTIIVDQTPPAITLSTVASPTNQTGQTLSGTVSDATGVASVTVKVGSGPAANATVSGSSWSYPVSGLVSGSNALTVTALDSVGNSAFTTTTIIVDQSLPSVTLTSVSSPTNLTSQLLSGTVSSTQAVASITVQVGSGAAAAATISGNSWSYQLSALPSGSNAITIVVRNALGNTASITSTIIVDKTAPTVSIAPVSSPTRLSSQSVSGSVTDNIGVASVTVQLGSGAPAAATLTPGNPSSWSYALSGLNVGSNAITVTALDTSGNSSSTGSTIVVDQTAPTISLTTVASPTNQTAQTLSGTVSDTNGVASVTVQVGSGPAANAIVSGSSWSFPVSGLALGSNTITITALDSVGNSATATATIIVDQSLPSVTLTNVSSPTNLTSQLLSGTVNSTQAVTSVTVQVGSGAAAVATISGNSWSYQLSALPAGSNAITIVVRNVVGTTASITSTIIVDQAPPVITLAAVTSPTSQTGQRVSGTVSDTTGVASVTVKVGSGPAATATVSGSSWSYSVSGLVSGSNTITVTALDSVGNSATATGTIIIDQSVPIVTLASVSSPTNLTSQLLSGTVSSTQAVASVTVQVGSAAAAAATISGSNWSYQLSALPAGSNSVTIVVRNTLGTTASIAAAIIVDQTPPAISISTVASPTNQTGQTLSGTVSDATGVASVTVKVGSGPAASATVSGSSWSYPVSGLASGSNAITVTALDSVGNSATATTTIIVDQSLPSVTLTSVSSPTNLTSQLLSGTVNSTQAVSSVTVQVGSGTAAAATISGSSWSYQLSALPAGSNAITIVVRNALGNTASITSTIIVDQTGPAISLTPVTSPTNQTGQTVSGTVSDATGVASVTVQVGSGAAANATVSGSSWSYPVSGLVSGSNTITVTALDSVGNSAFTTTTIIVDQSVPIVTLDSVSSPTNLTSQLLSGTVNSTQAVSSVTVQVGSAPAAEATITGSSWSYQLSALQSGSNSVTIVAGNVVGTTASITATISVDQIPPAISLSTVASPTSQTGQTVSGTVTDANGVASVTVQVGSGPIAGATVSGSSWSFPVSGLAIGSNSITVTALDNAGNSATATTSIIVDQSLPSVTLASVSSPTNLTSQLLSGTVSSTLAVASVTVQVGSAPAAVATITGNNWSYQLSALQSGSNSVTIVAGNVVGNTASITSTIIVDQTPPAISLAAVTSPINQTAQTVSGTVSDASGVASVRVQVGSGPATNATVSGSSWSYSVSGLALGSNAITVTALDSVGNSASATASIIVDQSVPTVTLTGVSSPTNLTSQLLSGTVSSTQTVASVTVQVGSAPAAEATITGNSWSYQLSSLPVGSNAITIVVRNAVGTTASITATIIVDQSVPTVTLASVSSPTRLNNQLLSGTVSSIQAVASVTVQVGSAAAAAATITGNSWSYQLSALPEGPNAITVVAGNVVGTTASITATIIVDQTPPTLIVNPVTTPTALSSQTLSGTVSDVYGIQALTINATAVAITADGTFSHIVTLNDGSNSFTLDATDKAGNTSQLQRTIMSATLSPSGDINGDGVVTMADALLVLRIAVGLDVATADNYAKADVSPLVGGKPAPDGVIDIGDAALILQKVLGLKSW